jgi:hypothetical protein
VDIQTLISQLRQYNGYIEQAVQSLELAIQLTEHVAEEGPGSCTSVQASRSQRRFPAPNQQNLNLQRIRRKDEDDKTHND